MIGTLWQDLTYAARTFRRWRGFTLLSVSTLALGVGGAIALFSVVKGVLLDPLPYPAADRLVAIWETERSSGDRRQGVSVPDFFDWKAQSVAFERMAAYQSWEQSLSDDKGDPERVVGASVSHELFALLGREPLLGRPFLPAEDAPGGPRVAVISYALWRARLGGRDDVLGTLLRLDGVPYAIVGVMPPSFVSPGDREEACWVPLQHGPTSLARARHVLRVFARLKAGITRERAQADMSAIAKRLEERYPEDNLGRSAHVEDLKVATVREIRSALLLLSGAVALLLGIACVNVAGGLLARALSRRKEIAIRAAVGAGRSRLVRQLLTESTLLSLVGGLFGIVFASAALWLFRAYGPPTPRADEVAIDAGVLLFALAMSLATGAVFGVIPAWSLSRPNLSAELKEGGAPGGLWRQPMWSLLVVTQVALAMALTAGAGVLIGGFAHLIRVNPGFRTQNLLKFDLTFPKTSYPFPETFPAWPKMTSFYGSALQRIGELPGVESVGAALNHPLRPGWTTQFEIEGRPPAAPGAEEEARIRSVSPAYFQTIGQPLLRGRAFTERDAAGAPPAMIINEAMARRYFASVDPIGRRVSFWNATYEIVGIVKDERFMGLAAPAEPALYPSLFQLPTQELSVLVRTRQQPMELVPSIRRVIRGLDLGLAVSGVSTMEQVLADSVARPRFTTVLVSAFATVALVLAAGGLYALMLYSVGHRTREIGIRVALGARGRDVFSLVLNHGVTLLATGLALGAALALAGSRLVSLLAQDLGPIDPSIVLGVSLVLTIVGMLACVLPASAAVRVDSVVAMRCE